MKPLKFYKHPTHYLYLQKCLKFFIENKNLITSYNFKVIKGREYFCNELRKKNLVNNGKGYRF